MAAVLIRFTKPVNGLSKYVIGATIKNTGHPGSQFLAACVFAFKLLKLPSYAGYWTIEVVFGLSILFHANEQPWPLTNSSVTCEEADWLELIKVQVGDGANQPSMELALNLQSWFFSHSIFDAKIKILRPTVRTGFKLSLWNFQIWWIMI